jgi:hypothetical protein
MSAQANLDAAFLLADQFVAIHAPHLAATHAQRLLLNASHASNQFDAIFLRKTNFAAAMELLYQQKTHRCACSEINIHLISILKLASTFAMWSS